MGAINPDERAVAGLREELRIHQGAQQRITHVALEAPQALCLRGRQAKSGHFQVFALNSLKHLVDTHGFVSKQVFYGELSGAVLIATPVPAQARPLGDDRSTRPTLVSLSGIGTWK
jgi:hypothetical protein